MKAVISFVSIFVLCWFGASSVEASCNGLSTAKIIGKLCYVGNNRSNATLIDGFYGCYDQAPGKQQFVDCQTEAFGAPMNTVESLGAACKTPYKIPKYSKCLKSEFENAGLDLDSAVKTVNACQSEVMGIGPSKICEE